ncbi:MAG TPA: hypothetical protein VIJ01_11150 [Candidatus Angelobacter sp.]
MKNLFSNTNLAIWLVMIAGKVVLCLCILKKNLVRRLPWVSAYVFASTIKSLFLVALAFLASYTVYYYSFFVASFMLSAIALLTLLEFWRQVLPGFDLPHNKQALGWLVAALGGVAIFAIWWPVRYVEDRIEVASYLAIAVAFIFIAGYARYLGLRWSRLVGGVSFTLGVLYLVDGVAKALMAHYSYHSPAFSLIRHASEIVSILAATAWIIVILSPWGERQITEEELLKLEQLVDHMEADFIAAVRKGKFLTGGEK